ncbi:Lipid A biosynthesis lauroyltransferase [invertebrate metagenome]|uniref:Lipid A biosynthesis lauroyltransferase n=1 Tax=invertebrate metagenome TaxID=1711999 RepID=A0A2H9TAN6_9ZZZZ
MSTTQHNTLYNNSFHWSFLSTRYWLTWLGLCLSFFVSLLPFVLILFIGRCIGRFFYYTNGSRVVIARINLSHCFPEKSEQDRESLLRKNFEAVGMGIMEVCIAWWWPHWRLKRKVKVEGLEHLKKDDGRGTVLMIMHFTTVELAGSFVPLFHSIDATYREHKNPVFEYVQRNRRQRHEGQGELLGRRDVRGMIRSLKRGRTVWYAPDQDYGRKHSIFTRFFGIQTAMVTGTSRFARMGNARVIPMTLLRKPGAKGYQLRFYPPLPKFPSDDEQADTQRVSDFIEKQIEAHPDQYMWLHRRFKTRPEGETLFYPKKQH